MEMTSLADCVRFVLAQYFRQPTGHACPSRTCRPAFFWAPVRWQILLSGFQDTVRPAFCAQCKTGGLIAKISKACFNCSQWHLLRLPQEMKLRSLTSFPLPLAAISSAMAAEKAPIVLVHGAF